MRSEKKNIIGPKLRLLREKSGLTASALAARLTRRGCSLNEEQLVEIEAGRRRLFDRDIPAIARCLSVAISDLFSRRKRQ